MILSDYILNPDALNDELRGQRELSNLDCILYLKLNRSFVDARSWLAHKSQEQEKNIGISEYIFLLRKRLINSDWYGVSNFEGR